MGNESIQIPPFLIPELRPRTVAIHTWCSVAVRNGNRSMQRCQTKSGALLQASTQVAPCLSYRARRGQTKWSSRMLSMRTEKRSWANFSTLPMSTRSHLQRFWSPSCAGQKPWWKVSQILSPGARLASACKTHIQFCLTRKGCQLRKDKNSEKTSWWISLLKSLIKK